MNRMLQRPLRRLSATMRPLALRSAGTSRAGTAVIEHVGRRSGRAYRTPVTAFAHEDGYLIALPYGELTDWSRNVLAQGRTVLEVGGQHIAVDEPRIVSVVDVADGFPPRERRMLGLFRVESAMSLRRAPAATERPAGSSADGVR